MTEKLCKDCKYYHVPWWSRILNMAYLDARCLHPHALVVRKEYRDKIVGKYYPSFSYQQKCYLQRPYTCDGRDWEVKE